MLSSAKLFQESQGQLDHNRLLSLINSLSEGFLAIDENGAVELSNSLALSLLDTNSLDGKNIAQAMPVVDRVGQTHNILELVTANTTSFVSSDYKLQYSDGSAINLYLNVSVVRTAYGGQNKTGYVVLFRDITKEKSAQQERDEFISVASHELRNPVAVAEGSISNALLLAERSQLPGNIQQVLKSAHEQIVFLSSLINDLAMISRADKQQFNASAAEFDPIAVITSLQSDYMAAAQKKGLEVKIEAQNLPKIFGSQLYTKEVLQNFITNAIKYTENGNLTIKGVVAGDGVDFSVADTGIGIQTDEHQKLFDKFFRSQDSRVRQINGSGLGLYVSEKLVKLMNGEISMQSEYNKGSVFTLHLPLDFRVHQSAAVASKTVA